MSRSSVNSYIDNQLPDNNQQLIKPVNARNVTKKLLDDSFNKADDDTDDINEGSSNLFFTQERVADAIAMVIQPSDDGNLTWTYDDSAGTLTPTLTVAGGSQDIEQVLTEGNDAGGLLIKNIGDGVDPQDAVTVSQLSSAVASIPVLYVGWFSSLANLELSYPTAQMGQYGLVDAGSGSDVLVYFWDNDEGWVLSGSVFSPTTATIGDITASNTAIADNDTITVFAGKAQGQIEAKVSKSGDSMTGALNEAQGTDIASATTTNIGAATGNYVNVTGTTTITGLGTVQAGTRRIVRFSGALTLTHNATSLILPSSANITTVSGDVAHFISLGSGNWKCVSYTRQDGTALVGSASAASETVAGIAEIATTAETTTGTDDLRIVTPLKLAAWWTNIKTLAHTWSLKQIFTGGVQIPSAAGVYDANGNKILEFSGTTSATDYLQLINAISSGAVTLIPTGSTTNMPLRIASKGASSFYIRTNSTDRIEITSAGLMKLLAYTASETKVATIATDGTLGNSYGIRDMRINEQWTALSSIVLAAKTAIMGADYGSLTIPTADINRLGAIFSHYSRHKYTVAASGQGNVQLDLDWGSTNLWTTGSLAIPGVEQGLTKTVYITFFVTTTTTGASGKLQGWVLIETPNLSFLADGKKDIDEVTCDLTGDQQLKLSVTWGTASVNSWSSKSGITEIKA